MTQITYILVHKHTFINQKIIENVIQRETKEMHMKKTTQSFLSLSLRSGYKYGIYDIYGWLGGETGFHAIYCSLPLFKVTDKPNYKRKTDKTRCVLHTKTIMARHSCWV